MADSSTEIHAPPGKCQSNGTFIFYQGLEGRGYPNFRFWITAERIQREVISTEIGACLGPDSHCWLVRDETGYKFLIAANRSFTQAQIEDLEQASGDWFTECQGKHVAYNRSRVHRSFSHSRSIPGPGVQPPQARQRSTRTTQRTAEDEEEDELPDSEAARRRAANRVHPTRRGPAVGQTTQSGVQPEASSPVSYTHSISPQSHTSAYSSHSATGDTAAASRALQYATGYWPQGHSQQTPFQYPNMHSAAVHNTSPPQDRQGTVQPPGPVEAGEEDSDEDASDDEIAVNVSAAAAAAATATPTPARGIYMHNGYRWQDDAEGRPHYWDTISNSWKMPPSA